MSVILRIKRTEGLNNPTTLMKGELGVSLQSGKLFVGTNDTTHDYKMVGEGTFLELSGGTITGQLEVPNPQYPGDAANKRYVDDIASGLDIKESVVVVATTNQIGDNDGNGEFTYFDAGTINIDGVDLMVGMRVLLAAQDLGKHNGIYVVTDDGSGGRRVSMMRADDASGKNFTPGAFTFVEQGNEHEGTGWVCTFDGEYFEEDNQIVFVHQFSGGGVTRFQDLSDTPSSYASQNGKSVRVNEAADGLEFFTPTFLELGDTPTSYGGEGGSLVRVKEDRTGLEFINPSTVGRTKFIQLDDCPSDYSNGSIVVSGANGIEFATNKVFGGLFEDVPDTIGSAKQTLVSNGESMDFVDFKLTSLADCPITMGAQHQMLAVGASNNLVFVNVDGSPVNNNRNPISSDWAYGHSAATHTVHGAPAGSNLLHENSIIDGGTW